jgi:phage baseplate assembly protein W
MADFVLKGCPYPIVKTAHGYLFSQEGVNQIKSDLLSLLLTNPRERVMHPDFGCDLRSLMFEPADAILERSAKALINNAVTKWEPRIAFEEISATVDEDTNSLNIKIAFRDPQNIRDIEVLELELPLGQGVTNQ